MATSPGCKPNGYVVALFRSPERTADNSGSMAMREIVP